MAEVSNEKMGVRFDLPDRPNVLQVATYDSVLVEFAQAAHVIRLWEAAKVIVQNWSCEALPDMKADLSKVEDMRVVAVIEWAGGKVMTWRRSLDAVPKN